MAKLTVEQTQKVEELIKNYNEESEILTKEYEKAKEEIEDKMFEADVKEEEHDKNLSELLGKYKSGIKEKVNGIIDEILEMVGDVLFFTNGYTIHNNLDIYTIKAEDLYLEIICDDDDSNKIIEYTLK